MKVYIKSIGCKVNQAESDEMINLLSSSGIKSACSEKEADVCIINTCTVTQRADADSRNAVRRALKNNPSCKVVVTGCYSKLYPEKVLSIPGVNVVTGNSAKKNITKILEDMLSEEDEKKIIQCEDDGLFIASSHSDISKRTRAFLKIQDGCNSNCTYCIVPRARGKSRSAGIKDVENAFRRLIDEGFREIVLTGIHLGDFGRHSQNGESLGKLIERLILINGNFRIRISSIEPREISDHLVEIISSTDKVASHLHIPLQSGDDGILSAMGRNYSREFFENLIRRVCFTIKGVNVGLDVITGFPGESREQFQNTCNFIKGLPVGYLHVFSYSDRQGTKASGFQGKVSSLEIKERAGILREIGREKKEEFREEFISSTERVLVERKSKRGKNFYRGFTDNYIPVVFKSSEKIEKNEFVRVNILRFGEDETMEGEAVY